MQKLKYHSHLRFLQVCTIKVNLINTCTYACNCIHFFIILGFSILKSKYKEILKYFPKDFYKSIHKLQHKLSDDQIRIILSCSNIDTTNKMILDCLIEGLKDDKDLVELCDQLNLLTDISPDLKHVITELRKGFNLHIHMYNCVALKLFI